MAQKSSIQQALYLAILRDLTLELCFDAFKARESNRLPCSLCGKFCRQYVFKAGHDIYGQRIDNGDANGELVDCPQCGKSVAAARFAPHLEKCMGLGRTARTSKRSFALSTATTSAITTNASTTTGRRPTSSSARTSQVSLPLPTASPSSTSETMEEGLIMTAGSSVQPSSKKRRTKVNPNEAVSTLDAAMLLGTPSESDLMS